MLQQVLEHARPLGHHEDPANLNLGFGFLLLRPGARCGHSTLMPALVGCGSLHIPIQRVLPIVALSAAVYVSALLALVIALGETVMRDVGNWTWVVPVALVTGITLWLTGRRLARRGS
jgi:hypothetical protein